MLFLDIVAQIYQNLERSAWPDNRERCFVHEYNFALLIAVDLLHIELRPAWMLAGLCSQPSCKSGAIRSLGTCDDCFRTKS